MTISVAFALIVITATCVLVALRALGTVWPWERVAAAHSVPPRQEPLHWVPTKHSGRIRRQLEEHGYYVLDVGSVNGMTALAICDGRTP